MTEMSPDRGLRPLQRFFGNDPFRAKRPLVAIVPPRSDERRTANRHMIVKNPIPDERNPFADIADERLVRMEFQAELVPYIFPYPVPDAAQMRLVRMNDEEIIHIPPVPFLAEPLLHEMVEAVEIDIGEQLARKIADREPASLGDRNGSAAVSRRGPMSGIVRRDDLPYQIEGSRTPDSSGDDREQNFPIYALEIFADIALQSVREWPARSADLAAGGPARSVESGADGSVRGSRAHEKSPHATSRIMCSFAGSTGVRIRDEPFLEFRPDNGDHRVLNDPITKCGRGNQPRFRIGDQKTRVGSGTISAGLQEITQE